MKFEKYEIRQVVMIAYVEVVVKNWECLEHFDMYAV
jgi:hypothetical protein